MKKIILLFAFTACFINVNSQPIHVSGKYILGVCNDTILLHGINWAAFNWGWDSIADNRFDQIALTGANCIRIPWYSTGSDAPGNPPLYNEINWVDSAIGRCIRYKMIPIIELHDLQCPSNVSQVETPLSNWYLQPKVLAIINKYKNSLIINIANEAGTVQWANNPANALTQFQSTYQTIVSNLRAAGITIPLMIDAPDCGTDINDLVSIGATMETNDPQHNLIFSPHAYWYGITNNDSTLERNLITNALSKNIPIVLGEVANWQDGDVACEYQINYKVILEICQELKVNWLAWSWDHESTCTSRQISSDGTYANLTTYGNDIVNNSIYGIKHHTTLTSYLANGQSCGVQTVTAGSGTICKGSSITITAGGANTYKWNNGLSGSSITVSPSVTTTYIVTGTATNGSNTVQAIVTVNVKPTVTAYGGTICTGASMIISASGANTYTWSNGLGTGVIKTVNPTITTTYSATGTDVNNCTNTATAIVTVDSKPGNPATITGAASVCLSSSGNVYSIAPVSGATNYIWSVPVGASIFSGQGTTSITVNFGTIAGNVGVQSSTLCGTSAATNKAVTFMTVPAAPAAIMGNATVCQGSAQTYSVAPVVNATTYTWSVPSDATIKSGQGSNLINVTWGITSYTLSVTASNCNGATAATTKTVTVPKPSNPSTIIGNAYVCEGSSQTYSVAPVTNLAAGSTTTYTWSVPADATINSGQGSNLINVTWGITSYTLSVTASNCNGTTAATTKSITLPIPTIPTTIIGNATICQGSTQTYSVAPVTNSVTGNTTTYTWSVPSNAINVTGQGTNVISLTWGNTSYTLSVTASNCNGKTLAATKTVTLPVPYALQTIISGNSTVCQGSIQTYSVPALPNSVTSNTTTYTWSIPSNATNVTGQGTNVISLTWGTTSYTLSVTASNCNGITAAATKAVTLPIPSALTSIISGNATVCQGSIQTYSVPALPNSVTGNTATYTWSVPSNATNVTGQGTNVISLTWGTTSYTLSVTASNCNGTTAAAIKAVTLPIPSAPSTIIGNATVCQGSTQIYSVVPVTNSVTGGTTIYTWSVPSNATNVTGQGTNVISLTWGTTSYTLSVIASNCNGKTAAATKAVTLPIPSAPSAIIGNASVCEGSTQTYSVAAVTDLAAGATTIYTWSVPSNATNVIGQGTNLISLTLGNTSYTLSVTASNCNGTTVASAKAITIPVLVKPATLNGNATICQQGGSATYSVTPITSTTGSTVTYTWSVPSSVTIIDGQTTNIVNLGFPASAYAASYAISITASDCNGVTSATTKIVKTSACSGAILTNVDEIKDASLNIEVFPNPNNGQFTLIMFNNNLNNENVKIQMLNMIGQVVYTEVVSSQDAGSIVKKDLHLSNFSDGTYFLRLLTTKKIVTKKIMVVN